MSISKSLKRFLWGTIPYAYLRNVDSTSAKLPYYKYIHDNGYTRHPYKYAEKYLSLDIQVNFDNDKGLLYVTHRGDKKLFFPKHFTVDRVKALYKALIIEQDLEAGHHYVDSVDEFSGKILLDIGAAEGIIALDAIEVVSFVYLFECDECWIEALEATFEPWKEKVEIVRKYISNQNDDQCMTLDLFLKDKPKDNLFLKMDIEGAERKALEGAEKLFEDGTNLQFAICIYHLKDDPFVISSFLDKYKCTYKEREGLFYMKHSFRPALIRGSKV